MTTEDDGDSHNDLQDAWDRWGKQSSSLLLLREAHNRQTFDLAHT